MSVSDFPAKPEPADLERYDNRTVVIHWITAPLVLFVFVLGLTVDSFPRKYAAGALNIHAFVGLSIFLISVMRITSRKATKKHSLPDRITRLARFGHLTLYFFLLAVPLIGIPALFFRGRSLDLGLFEMVVARNKPLARILTQTHLYAAYFFAALIVGHILAVFLHAAIWRDGTLRKMLPGRR